MTTTLTKRHGRGRLRRLLHVPDAGMTTSEYAVGTLAACAFAAVLMAVIKSGGISGLITDVITTALSALL